MTNCNTLAVTTDQVVGKATEHISAFSCPVLNKPVEIHTSVISDFSALQQAAIADGFELCIASGFRPFSRQLSIWNRKYTGELTIKDDSNEAVDITKISALEKLYAILRYSALPGASRHHWGSDIDVYALNMLPENQSLQLEPWEYQKNGYFYSMSQWLTENMAKYGFARVYAEDSGGIAPEPWHLSHLPTAAHFEQQQNVSMLKTTIEHCPIEGKALILQEIDNIFQRFIEL